MSRRMLSMLVLIAALASSPAHAPGMEAEPETVPTTVPVTERVAPGLSPDYVEATMGDQQVLVELSYVGEAQLTFFCSCSICCGEWAGSPTASGTTPTEGRTVAVGGYDLPYGALVYFDGKVYTHEDKPAQWAVDAAGGLLVDVYRSSHQECLELGRQHAALFVVDSMMGAPQAFEGLG